MHSVTLEQTSRVLTLCCLLLVTNLTYAQWNVGRIESLSDEANRLKAGGLLESAYELYPEIMHQMRIHEGLFSEHQLPLLMEMASWHVQRSELKEADDLLERAEFYIGKNPNPLNHYRTLALQRLYLPDEPQCFERVEDRFLNPSKDCVKHRYFRADSLIAATEIMIKVVAISNNRKPDLITLAALAEFTAISVYGVDGPSVAIEFRDDTIYKTENPGIRERYRFQKWSKIQTSTLAQLKDEFEYEVMEGLQAGASLALSTQASLF
ncbi:MAG: hypothetical protein QGF90_14505 [Gammaproteobacteria bacterium]|jgi:hypothetical protein|nr:hypothetical protein [Gammaproteobacteria bacterium]